MNNLHNIVKLNDSGCPVTTSLAIADGVGNPHSTVIKLIRQNTEDLEDFGNIGFEIQNSNSGAGRPTEYAILNEQQAAMLMTYMRNIGIVKEFKKRLVKAFFEMREELNRQQIDPMVALRDPATMRSLLLGYSEKVLELEDQLKVTQPKAEALDRIATADGSLCITDAAKQLQMRPKDLFASLQRDKWIYRRQGTSWLGYQDKLQQGVLEHKITEVDRTDGSSKITTQVRVTPKGLTQLSKMLTSHAA